MVGIQRGTVNNFLSKTFLQSLKSSSPRIIVVEIAFNPLIVAKHLQSFLHVGNGIKHKPVRSDDAELHSREVIHKTLKDGTHVCTITFQRNVLRRYAPLRRSGYAVPSLRSCCGNRQHNIVCHVHGTSPPHSWLWQCGH